MKPSMRASTAGTGHSGRSFPFWRHAQGLALLALTALLGILPAADAARVILRIQAGNRVDEDKRVEIKSNLPEGVRTNDILSLGGLELGYDVKHDLYFVHRELTLGPKQIAVFDVEINDIWTVPEDELETLRTHTGRMVEMLRGEEPYETAVQWQEDVNRNLDRIRELQRERAIGPGVPTIEHIRAYESNVETLNRVKIDVGRLENLVLGTGRDPGGVYGSDKRSPKPERFLEAPADYTRTARVRIYVRNTSPTRRRAVPVRQDLPPEIREHDVLDAGGLDLATDVARGVAYVYKQDLELAPLEERTFNVLIRDKWNVSGPRIIALRKTGSEMLDRVAARGTFASVEDSLRGLLGEIEAVAAVTGPETVDADYVAFYRHQGDRLDDIESRLNRIIMALPQIERSNRIGFKLKAPSPKTTWMIIYIVLVFLAALSVVFYFRWSGKSQAERMDGAGPSDR